MLITESARPILLAAALFVSAAALLACSEFEENDLNSYLDADFADTTDDTDIDDTGTDTTDDTPDIIIRLASQGSLSYTLLEVIPPHYSDLVDIDPASNSDDLRFTFIEGLRYEIDNTLTNAHPFQFRDADFIPQLAQNEVGPLEDAPSIDWYHEGNIMRFTVSESFRDKITNYQCAPHIIMTGAIEYTSDDDL